MLTFFIVIVIFSVSTYLFVQYENKQKRKQSLTTMRESITKLDIFDFDMPCDEDTTEEVYYLITKSNPEGYLTVIPYGKILIYLELYESLRIEVYECIYIGDL